MNRAALVLIEFQNEWFPPAGKLSGLFQDGRQLSRSVEASRQALFEARRHRIAVVHMGLHLSADYRELGGVGAASHGLRAAIPRAGTFRESEPGHLPAPGFEPLGDELIGAGRCGASIFSGTNLDLYLRNQGIRQLYLAGFALHVCVLASLCQGHDLGYEMKLLDECSAAFTVAQRDFVLNEVVHHFGERVSNAEFSRRLERNPLEQQQSLPARSA
jgi:nicotinamidase-related amidase